MKDIIDQIWNYGQLHPDEQRRVETYASTHAEAGDLLEEVKLLYDYIQEAQVFRNGTIQDAALGYYIASTYIDSHTPPPLVEESIRRMKDRLSVDPNLMQQYIVLKRRMDDIASSSNPVAEFERLTGHTLDDQAPFPGLNVGSFASDRAVKSPVRSSASTKRWNWKRYAVVLIPILITFAWFGNQTSRVAYTDPADVLYDTEEVVNRALKGPIEDQPIDVVVVRAQSVLIESQRSLFNLLYWYQQDGLEEAEELFEIVLRRDDATKRMNAMSSFYLGKIELIQGNLSEAKEYFESALLEQGAWSIKTRQLLEYIRENR